MAGDSISYTDSLTGIHFKGQLDEAKIVVTANLGDVVITTISYERHAGINASANHRREPLDDGWNVAPPPLSRRRMERDILDGPLEGTEGVLVATKPVCAIVDGT